MSSYHTSPPKPRAPAFQPTPKMSSRPRQMTSKLQPSAARSPPLTTSLNANAPSYPSPLDTMLSPKQSSVKLKIKSLMSPEARGRSKPLMPGSRTYHRAITPSDSEGSLAEPWVQPSCGGRLRDEEEELGEQEAVLVTVRIRPPSDAEMRSSDPNSVWMTPSYDDHLLRLPRGREGSRDDREWMFDRILPPESDNARAYATSARAHVRSAMEGFNAVIFAYGQTASGKTFTLTGSPSNPGIIPLAITDLFAQIRSTPDREFLLRASYLELYNESILDLLSPEAGKELTLSEGKKKGEVVINGLTECGVRTEEEVRRLLRVGEDRRKVGGTDWNQRSSRSHCVFRIVIESRARTPGDETPLSARTPGGRLKSAGEKMTRISTMSIIDLAGSERHTSSKERNAEGKHINQSLLTLKLVISKLADVASKRNVSHVPYRDSKLTRLLQPSLSGDALISVICTVSPSVLNVAESLSTLSFAQGLKRVVLRAQKKEVVDPQALIQQYQNEIAELRALLLEKEDGGFVKTSKGELQKNEAMEKRLNELKSLILTSVNVNTDHTGPAEARPLSPTKLKYPKLDFDKSTTELQEDLHAAEIRMASQQAEIDRLKDELDARPLNPNVRILELQEEVGGLKMIAADYERHLREPSRKVREDVEREWSAKLSKLEGQLESKRIWANRLDENVRAVTAENKDLHARCSEAESKVYQIIDWLNAALAPDPDENDLTIRPSPSIPALMVSHATSAAGSDFAPPTLTRMTRAQLSHMDLASFNDRFGSLTVGGGRRGVRMLREESGFDLAMAAEEDEVF